MAAEPNPTPNLQNPARPNLRRPPLEGKVIPNNPSSDLKTALQNGLMQVKEAMK